MPEAEKRRPTDEAGIEDDFLYHLYRGGELLAGGQNQEARDELERAFHLKPRNQKAQNLLGLVYFKLGLLERSAEIYEMLVQDNPTDATLRVNLGLVHLKAGEHDRSHPRARDRGRPLPRSPEALNYLGLAYTQARQHAKALADVSEGRRPAPWSKRWRRPWRRAAPPNEATGKPAAEPPPAARAAPAEEVVALPAESSRRTPPPAPSAAGD